MALVAVIFAGAVALTWQKSESNRAAAEEQARIAESRRLAAESSSALSKYPQRSLLLAIEAVKAQQPLRGVRGAAAEQSLREALGVIGGGFAVRAAAPLTTLAISPDSRWLVTASWYKSAVQLWDLSAEEPASNSVWLQGLGRPATAVAISADSRWLVTASEDHTAHLWDLKATEPGCSRGGAAGPRWIGHCGGHQRG
jgi:hypothetical protein